MAGMRAPHRRNMRVMPGRCQPVGNCRTDRSATAFAAALVIITRLAGDQQYRAMASRDTEFKRAVEPPVGGRQCKAVQVDGNIGLHHAFGETAIPATIQPVAGRHRFLVA